MRKFFSVFVFVLLACLSFAQNAFDFEISQVELLLMKPVQRDLGISEMQRKRMNTHADWFNAESKKLQEQYNGRQPDEAAVKKLSELHGQMKARVFAELTANQLKRLREISLQEAGALALLDERVASACGLSDATIKQFRSEFETNGKKARELEEKTLKPIFDKYQQKAMAGDTAAQQALEREVNAARQKIGPQLAQLQGAFLQFINKTLTDEQKEKFGELQGLPFAG